MWVSPGTTTQHKRKKKGCPMPREALTRGPYRNGIRRRREIIESAAKVFGQFGYAGGSLRNTVPQQSVTLFVLRPSAK